MDTNAGLIIKLCVFALDLFIIIFNFITLKHYFPLFGRDKQNHVEMKSKAQQTYLAGDMDSKAIERKSYLHRGSTSALLTKNMPNSSYNRNNANHQMIRHCQKYYPDRDRDYKKAEEKYAKSVCHCDYCKDGKRLVATK